MSVHSGHRQRVKDRYLKVGLDNFEEYQILELLLFYCLPRVDTNEIAHRLIKQFGSLAKVMDAPLAELEKVDGIGYNAAVFLKLVKDAGRSYLLSSVSKSITLRTIDDCVDYLVPFFDGRVNEAVYLLCLDANCNVLNCEMIEEGDVNFTAAPIRKIVNTAISSNATSVVLAHNHPGSVAIPSPEDIQTTMTVATALAAVGITLNDHIIVAARDGVSLAQSGYYSFDKIKSALEKTL